MNKKKVYLLIGSIALVCILAVVLLFSCQEKEPVSVSKNPQRNEVKTYESDVEISDYEEFDYTGDATSAGRDKSFNQVKTNNTTPSDAEKEPETSNDKDGESAIEGGLIVDETKSSGSNHDLNEWNN